MLKHAPRPNAASIAPRCRSLYTVRMIDHPLAQRPRRAQPCAAAAAPAALALSLLGGPAAHPAAQAASARAESSELAANRQAFIAAMLRGRLGQPDLPDPPALEKY